MATGIVKFFNPVKGFGLITQDTGGPPLFVHTPAGFTQVLQPGHWKADLGFGTRFAIHSFVNSQLRLNGLTSLQCPCG